MKNLPRLIIFASGTKNGGGSGFGELVRNSKKGMLKANIIAVVSDHTNGGVRRIADEYNIPFVCFEGPWTENMYKKIILDNKAEWIALSGWLKLVKGLAPKQTINIHPGPLPQFGGVGMYGRYVHEAVMEAFRKGKITESAVSMHFVTEKYDEGPIIFRKPVPIEEIDTPETLAARVNKVEHKYQAFVTDLVVNKQIKWDGKDPKTLVVPKDYPFLN